MRACPDDDRLETTYPERTELGAARRGVRKPARVGLLPGLILAAATALAYAGSLGGVFVYDDIPAIVVNPSIQHWTSALTPPPNTTATCRPVLNASLALNYWLSGLDPWSYHVVNVLIHIAGGLALWGLCRRLLKRRLHPDAEWLAFSIALLWLLHPLQTESVAYVVQRAESLMGMFYLLTLYAFLRGAESRRPALWHFVSFIACALGMGTKEVMVSAPIAALLLDRTFISGSFREAWRRHAKAHLALASTWIVVFSLLVAGGGNRGSHSIGSGSGASWGAYFLTQFPAIVHYLQLTFWPRPLVFEYGAFWVHRFADVWPQAVVVVALALATVWALVRRPAWGFLGFAFFAILAPTSLIPGTKQMIVEHRMYLALIPVLAAAVFAVNQWRRQIFVPLAIAGAAALGLLTWQRNQVYRSAESLWRDTVEQRPGNALAHSALGASLSVQPLRRREAMTEFETALRLDPANADTHYDLANLLADDPDQLLAAIQEYRTAAALDPADGFIFNNLGNAYLKLHDLDDAIDCLRQAVRLRPEIAEAHNNLALALAHSPGHWDEAVRELGEVVRLKPDDVAAQFNLGLVLSRIPGQGRDARMHLEEALRLQPDNERIRGLIDRLPSEAE